MTRRSLLALALSGFVSVSLSAQVSSERLRNATDEPHNWLTYSGTYFSQR